MENVQSGMEHNFNKYTTTQAGYGGTVYDYGSLMHYESTAFSKNGQPTIVPLQAGISLIPAYNKNAMTTEDVKVVRNTYGC